jgi:hypothetical protein
VDIAPHIRLPKSIHHHSSVIFHIIILDAHLGQLLAEKLLAPYRISPLSVSAHQITNMPPQRLIPMVDADRENIVPKIVK